MPTDIHATFASVTAAEAISVRGAFFADTDEVRISVPIRTSGGGTLSPDTLSIDGAITADDTGVRVSSPFVAVGAVYGPAPESTWENAADAESDLYTAVADGVGTLDIAGKHYIMLDFSSYDGTTMPVEEVKLPAGVHGRQLVILMKKGASAGTHVILDDNFGNMATGDTIVLSADPARVALEAVGTKWLYTSLANATFTAAQQ